MRIAKPNEKPERIYVPRPIEKPKERPIYVPDWPVKKPQEAPVR